MDEKSRVFSTIRGRKTEETTSGMSQVQFFYHRYFVLHFFGVKLSMVPLLFSYLGLANLQQYTCNGSIVEIKKLGRTNFKRFYG